MMRAEICNRLVEIGMEMDAMADAGMEVPDELFQENQRLVDLLFSGYDWEFILSATDQLRSGLVERKKFYG